MTTSTRPSPGRASDPATGPLRHDSGAPRGSLRLLVDPVFGPYFLGKLLSTAGVWMHNIAAAIVVFELTRSATLVGAVSIAQFAPQLVLTPLFGALADRGNRKRQVVTGRLVTASGSGALALWIAAFGLEGATGAAVVIAAALVVGIGFSVGGPAMQALIPSLVRREELATAVALNAAPFTIARAGGPALGALVVTGAGPAWAFALAALGNLAFAVLVGLARIREVARARGVDTSIVAGLRHIRADRALLVLLVAAAGVGIGADPVITLSPPIAEALGGGSRLVGWLASTFGIGAAAAFVLLGVLRRTLGLERLAPIGLTAMAGGLAVVALAGSPAGALVGMAVGGAGMTLGVTSLSTQLQQRAPEELRGRVMAVWMVAFLGSRPLAAGMNGVVADAVSAPAALAVVVALLLTAAWSVRPSRIPAHPTDEMLRAMDERQRSDRIAPERVVAATGREPDAWFALLDDAGAAELPHRDIAAHLVEAHEVPAWWAQHLTVAYERARGRRLRHETPEGFAISRSMTIAGPRNQVFHALHDEATRARWLEVPLDVTSSRPEHTVNGRLPVGRVTISVAAKGETRTTVRVGHLKLPDAAAAEQAKADWTARLQRLADLVS